MYSSQRLILDAPWFGKSVDSHGKYWVLAGRFGSKLNNTDRILPSTPRDSVCLPYNAPLT